MAYADLARSHVKECLREAFELETVHADDDGDFPFPFGTAVFFVSVRQDGQQVKVWSPAVTGLKPTAAVLREVNEVNTHLEQGRAYLKHGQLMIEGVLAVDSLTPDLIRELAVVIGSTADSVGQMVSAVHGGEVMLPEGEQDCDHCS